MAGSVSMSSAQRPLPFPKTGKDEEEKNPPLCGEARWWDF